jgi:voltage-gated potassium channel
VDGARFECWQLAWSCTPRDLPSSAFLRRGVNRIQNLKPGWIAGEIKSLLTPTRTGGDQLLLTGLTITFLKEFGLGLWLSLPLSLSLATTVALLGLVVGRKEGWSRFDSVYWSFITATTVGYGDIRPVKRASRIIAIVVALLGLTLTGILIALAVHAATLALAVHDAIEEVR